MKTHNELLAEWKARLGLCEWRIKLVDKCAPEDMTLQGTSGCADWTEAIKTARIEILDPAYYGDRKVSRKHKKFPFSVVCMRVACSSKTARWNKIDGAVNAWNRRAGNGT